MAVNLKFQEKQEQIKKIFQFCQSNEERYLKIMEMGKALPLLSSEKKIEANLVSGCQSLVYLYTHFDGEKLYFNAYSDALISAGLAALLITLYNGETPETLLKCPPSCLAELGIQASLSPARSNGLASIYLRMKQDAVKFLLLSR